MDHRIVIAPQVRARPRCSGRGLGSLWANVLEDLIQRLFISLSAVALRHQSDGSLLHRPALESSWSRSRMVSAACWGRVFMSTQAKARTPDRFPGTRQEC